MKLTFVENVPAERVKKNHKLQEFIKEFAESNHKVAKVDFTDGEYKNAYSCVNALRRAIKHSKRPVTAFQRGDEVYLAKKYL